MLTTYDLLSHIETIRASLSMRYSIVIGMVLYCICIMILCLNTLFMIWCNPYTVFR